MTDKSKATQHEKAVCDAIAKAAVCHGHFPSTLASYGFINSHNMHPSNLAGYILETGQRTCSMDGIRDTMARHGVEIAKTERNAIIERGKQNDICRNK